MIIGENSKADDLICNVTKVKQLTNVRSQNKDEFFKLQPHRIMTLEDVMSYVDKDEEIEITPSNIRLRKVSTEQDSKRGRPGRRKK